MSSDTAMTILPHWACSVDDELMAVSVRAAREQIEVSAPRLLFAVRPRPPVRLDAYAYDVSPDGRRFLVNALIDEPESVVVTLVLNWTQP
jgi:hypothetical protein